MSRRIAASRVPRKPHTFELAEGVQLDPLGKVQACAACGFPKTNGIHKVKKKADPQAASDRRALTARMLGEHDEDPA